MQKLQEKARYISKDFLTPSMIAKIIKLSGKGQIAIPQDMRKKLDLGKGDNLLIAQTGRKIIIEKAELALQDRFDNILLFSAEVAKELWDNKYDERWDNV